MLAQAGRQIAIQLDHGHAAGALHQRLRQRRQTGADLDQALIGLRIDGTHDAVDDALVLQEVLAKALARHVAAAARDRARLACTRRHTRRGTAREAQRGSARISM